MAPAATVTVGGTVSAALLSDTATVDPPVGATGETVTVQVETPPVITVAGEHCNPVTVTGITVTGAVAELPFKDAVTVTD